MIIYGTALLAICHLLGDYFGNTLGMLLGVKANVGGVAISMILTFVFHPYPRTYWPSRTAPSGIAATEAS